jgi:hypothetical protein
MVVVVVVEIRLGFDHASKELNQAAALSGWKTLDMQFAAEQHENLMWR